MGVVEVGSPAGNPTGSPGASRGLARPRVLHRLVSYLDHPMTLMVAPAGSGKSTTLLHLADSLDRCVAWYQADPTSSAPRAFLEGIQEALSPILRHPLPASADVAGLVTALGAMPAAEPTVLFVDDLHALAGAPSEATVEVIVRRMPPWLRIVAATRRPPGFNLPDLLLHGLAVEVDADLLRWRSWEVEQLFRSFYRTPLRPEEAARLTQRTEGWVAGLQLFHLATRRLPPSGREALVDRLHTSPGLVRDYLTRNVLGSLAADLRTFVVDTCVLGRLDPALCDALRDADDSERYLHELQRQRLFLVPTADGHAHRYHEVLRAYLEVSLLERDDPADVRARHGRAGRILEQHGALADAVHAYARAEAFDDAARVLGADGPMVVAGGGPSLLDRLPAPLADNDPWLQVIRARSLVGEGRLDDALAAYRSARERFGRGPAVATFQGQLQALESWVRNVDEPPRSPTDRLRSALRRDPRKVGSDAVAADSSPVGLLVGAVALLLAGAVDDARALVRRVGISAGCGPFAMAAADALDHLASVAAGGHADPDDLMSPAETFEHLGVPWLARLAGAVVSLQDQFDVQEAEVAWRTVDEAKDPWGRLLLGLAGGISAVCHDQPRPDWLDEAAAACRQLGAPVLQAWARAWEALGRAREGDADASLLAVQARSLARSILVPGAEAVAELATAEAGGPEAPDALVRARSLAGELGLGLPIGGRVRSHVEVVGTSPTSLARCFGGLRLTLHGRDVAVDQLKPQARTVLAMLLLHGGAPVHRDRLTEALWPGNDPAVVARRLPVLISTVRRHLEPWAPAGEWSLLVRIGEAHGLRLPPGTWSDVTVFDEAVIAARREGDHASVTRSLQVAFDAWGGELLPEFGPAEWVVRPREDRRLEFARVARALAAARLGEDEPSACVDIARSGLRADRYSSRLWDLLVVANRRVGDLAAAARAERDHRAVLAQLGVRPGPTGPGRQPGDTAQRIVRNSTPVMARSDPD